MERRWSFMFVALLLGMLFTAAGSQKPLCRDTFTSRSESWQDCRVQIGGLAIQGADAFRSSLGPTFEGYLTSVFNGTIGLEFEALPLNFNQNFEYVSGHQLDYIYSNPAVYTCMMVEFNIATMASLMNFRKGNALDEFAGVIFSRVESNFSTVEDLREAHVAAVSITGLGAMQLQQAELLRMGMNIMTDVKRLTFTSNQNKIVAEVQSGFADVGFVRTDMIDRSVQANKTKWEYFKVINEIDDPSFPFARSTAFTPEWPIGALPHVPPSVTEMVGHALMQLNRDSPDPTLAEPAIAGNFATWLPPRNYLDLLDMLQEIRYYNPEERKCLRAGDVLEAVNCPDGWVRQRAEVAFCAPELCKEGYQCLCQPCVKLKDPELVLTLSMLPTAWNPNENETAIELQSTIASSCSRMSKCASVVVGQRLHWELLDQIGDANRQQINQYRIQSVEMLTELDGAWQPLEPHNVTVDGLETQTYTLDTTVTTQGSALVQLRINGLQASMTPTIVEGLETPKQRVFCPAGHKLERNGTCSACPSGHRSEVVVSHQTGLLTDACLPCEVGTYQDQGGQDACLRCSIGTITSEPGQTACTRCGDGSSTLEEDGSAECIPCKPGQEASLTAAGQPSCSDCPAGQVAEEEGSLECTACAPGKFATVAGSLRCVPCADGSVANRSGLALCEPCPRGSYANASDRTSCQPCPAGMTTLDRGSDSASKCLCPAGTFLRPGLGCISCAELQGLECPQGNGPPLQLAGFWVDVLDTEARDYSVYRCRDRLECPSGKLGACASGRRGRACNDCLDHFHSVGSTGECKQCEGADVVPGVIALTVFFLLLFALVLMVDSDRVQQSLSRLTVLVVCGQVLMVLQALTAIRQLSIRWIEPVKSVFSLVRLVAFDLDLLQLACLLRKDTAHVKFAMQLLSYPCFVAMLLLVCGIFTLTGRRVSFDTFFNINGIILFMLFITFTLTVWLPFQCAPNPNHSLSMATNPGVICWESSEHAVLVVLACLGTLAYPVSIISWATWTVVKYPHRVHSGEGLRLIRRHRFLFERFQPQCYYYGLVLLCRNAAVALIPVVLVSVPTLQPTTFGVVLLFGLVVQSLLRPWRTEAANRSDIGSSCFLIMVLLGSAPLIPVDVELNEKLLGWLLLICVAGSLLTGAAIMCHSVYRRFFPLAHFDAFLCHHKQAAGSLCRWIKLQLQRHTAAQIFLDSDNLEDLDLLFDIVRCSIRTLVVVLTPDLLRRIWCAGEIATAQANKVPMVLLACDGFTLPAEPDIEKIIDAWTNEEKHVLCSRSISMHQVSLAFQSLMEWPQVRLFRTATLESQEHVLLDLISACRIPKRGLANLTASTGSPCVIVLGNISDLESLATCQILQVLLQRRLRVEVDVIRDPAVAQTFVQSALYLVVVLTRGMLLDLDFVRAFVSLVEASSSSVVELELVSVNADTGFQFPNSDFYNRLERDGLAVEEGGTNIADFLSEAYRVLFANLALPLTPHGSEGLLNQQVDEISGRLLKCRRSSMVSRLSSDSITEAVVQRRSSRSSNHSSSVAFYSTEDMHIQDEGPLPTPIMVLSKKHKRRSRSSAVTPELKEGSFTKL